MPDPAGSTERLVHAVLAAQVNALRDRIESSTVVALLCQAIDALNQLTETVTSFTRLHSAIDPALKAQCAAALQQAGAVGAQLETYAFVQAQQQDIARQMADCISLALHRLATTGLSPGDLMKLYVTEDQRRIHAEAARHE
jgi:hypothetical protein